MSVSRDRNPLAVPELPNIGETAARHHAVRRVGDAVRAHHYHDIAMAADVLNLVLATGVANPAGLQQREQLLLRHDFLKRGVYRVAIGEKPLEFRNVCRQEGSYRFVLDGANVILPHQLPPSSRERASTASFAVFRSTRWRARYSLMASILCPALRKASMRPAVAGASPERRLRESCRPPNLVSASSPMAATATPQYQVIMILDSVALKR